jgi:2-polyprenyl-6-methoxyphenol hydroxylase-like FAD-dependent oxidoreductase
MPQQTMQTYTYPVVLIVGAGPVGLTLAAELARHGVRCRIVDKAPAPSMHSKALAIFPRTLEIFAQMGMLAPVLQAGRKLSGVNAYAQGRKLVHGSFADVDSPYPYAICLPQSEIEQILSAHGVRLGVTIDRGVELIACDPDKNSVMATLRHADGRIETCVTPWLAGCDGAHSTVRHALGMRFAGELAGETFVLADVEINWPFSADEVHFFLHQDGPLGIIPLPRPGTFRMVATLPADTAMHVLEAPTLAQMQSLLEARGPAGLVLRHPLWLSHFHVSYRKVSHLRAGSVFLAGDAAHIHSPAGGQGMNTGIQDAHNLAWKLARVVARRAPDSVLDSYTVEREPVARNVLRLTARATEAVTLRHPLARHLRDLLLPWLAGIEAIEHRVMENLAELTINYANSPLVAEDWGGPLSLWHGAGPAAGVRAPDGTLHVAPTGMPVRLFELLRDTRHSLLLFAGRDVTAAARHNLTAIGMAIRKIYEQDIAAHLIVADREVPPDAVWEGSILLDVEQAVHRRYGADMPCLYLVRPDGYIGFRSKPARAERLQAYLEHIF